MSKAIKLKKGFNINLDGKPELKLDKSIKASTFAVKPADFQSLRPIPKLTVEVGDEVLAGDPLFFDKPNPDVLFTSPVSGEVAEIRRGAKRAIDSVIIIADGKNQFKDFGSANPKNLSREDVKAKLKESGCWAFIKQRPFNIVAEPDAVPRDIFISAFDTNPLAADTEFTLGAELKAFQAGIDALNQLTDGDVYVGVNGGIGGSSFDGLSNCTVNKFSGPHPAGNVGVQIHHVKPINKGEIVWTVSPYDLVTIGKLFLHGKYDTSRTIAIGGPSVAEPKYITTYSGAKVSALLDGNINEENVRVVSGSALVGDNIGIDGFLGSFHHQLTILDEGDFYEMLGWILPSYPRPSISPTIPPFTLTTKFPFIKKVDSFNANTNTHGEKRAFVVTGQYEAVTPMDIFPQQLLKAILSNDLDKMEGLGIYEVVEEDMALCEFVCTSKFNVQETLRKGLDLMREQG